MWKARVFQRHISYFSNDVFTPRVAARLARPLDRPQI